MIISQHWFGQWPGAVRQDTAKCIVPGLRDDTTGDGAPVVPPVASKLASKPTKSCDDAKLDLVTTHTVVAAICGIANNDKVGIMKT